MLNLENNDIYFSRFLTDTYFSTNPVWLQVQNWLWINSFLGGWGLFLSFRATPMTYGGSQARSPVRTVAAGLRRATATWDPSSICDLHHSSWQHRLHNPLSEAGDGNHILMDASGSLTIEQQRELLTQFLTEKPVKFL